MLKLLRYPLKLLWSLAQVLLILALVLAIVATIKITGYEQSVNEQALASKQDYLKKIPAFSGIAESARPNIVLCSTMIWVMATSLTPAPKVFKRRILIS